MSRFAKVIKNENAALKAVLFVGGKFNKSAIMKESWARAARLASFLGGKASEFLAQAMKETWAIAKA